MKKRRKEVSRFFDFLFRFMELERMHGFGACSDRRRIETEKS